MRKIFTIIGATVVIGGLAYIAYRRYLCPDYLDDFEDEFDDDFDEFDDDFEDVSVSEMFENFANTKAETDESPEK